MALNMGQWPVAGTLPTCTFQIPPGPYNITLYNTYLTTIWLAIGTSPTSAPVSGNTASGTVLTNTLVASWLNLHSIPTSFNGYQGAGGGYLWALNTSASSTPSFNYILSTQER
jgi:hypothetical protein